MLIQKTKDYKLIREAAKILSDDGIKTGEKKLYDILRKQGVLMKNNEPYQRYIDAGVFVLKEQIIDTSYGGIKMKNTPLVTGKGLIFLNKKLREWLELEESDADIDLDSVGSSLGNDADNEYAWLDNM